MDWKDLTDYGRAVFIGPAVVVLILLAVSLAVTRKREGRWLTPVSAFLGFITVHGLVGYELAFASAEQIGRTGVAMGFYFDKAYVIIAIGLCSIFLGYIFCPIARNGGAERFLLRVAGGVSEDQLRVRARFLIALAVGLTAIGMAGYGSIPLFQSFAQRYTDTFNPAYGWTAFTVNRGRDFVQLPTAFLIIWMLRRKRGWGNTAFIIVAVAACILTVTRTPVVDILLVVIIAASLRGRASSFVLAGVFIVVGYLCTQLLFVRDTVDSGEQVLQIAGGALPELRDFANVLTNEPERLMGLTLLVGALPVPGFFSDFTSMYLIRTVTLQAVGIPLTAPHGGLRITYSGELYINFGLIGVVLGGLALGWLCGWFGRLFETARAAHDVRFDFLIASLWMMFSFQLYLSGSGVGGMLKVLLAVLAAFFIPWRKRREWRMPLQEMEARWSERQLT